MMDMVTMMMENKMYDQAHEYEVAVELAWRRYAAALEDVNIPYSRVVELRNVYERILNDGPCSCYVCQPQLP